MPSTPYVGRRQEAVGRGVGAQDIGHGAPLIQIIYIYGFRGKEALGEILGILTITQPRKQSRRPAHGPSAAGDGRYQGRDASLIADESHATPVMSAVSVRSTAATNEAHF